MTNTFKHKLLLGTALVAVGAFSVPAFATAPEEIAPANNQTPTAADEFVNDVDDGDTLELDLNNVDVTIGNDDGTAQTAAIKINAANADFFITDNENGGDGGGVLTIEADTDAAGVAAIDVANGKTLNLYVGVDDDGATLADDDVTVVLAGDVEENTSGVVNIIIGGNVDAAQVLQLNTGAVAQVIDADIKALTNGQGVLDIDTTGGVTINGDIGGATAGTDDLASVLLADGATVSSNGHIFATAITLGSANTTGATLTLTGTGKTVGGTINSDGGNDNGILNVNGTYTFTGAIGGTHELDSIVIGTAGSANFQANVDIEGTGADSLTLSGASSLVSLGKADAGGNSTVAFEGNILGKGIVTLVGDDTDNVGHTITGNVGTNTQSIATLNVGNDNENAATGSDVHTLTGDLYASTVAFTATDDAGGTTVGGTLLFTGAAANSTVSIGTVTTGVAGDGNITIDPAGANSIAVTVTGDVGTSTAGLNTILVGEETHTGDFSIDFDGNVYATQITVDEDSTGTDGIVSFTGGTQTVTADIDGQEAGEGDVNVGNGTSTSTVTFSGQLGEALSLSDFKVFTKSTAILSGADGGTEREHEFAGDITIDGTLRISENALLIANDVATGAAAGVLEFVIGTTNAGVDESGTLRVAQAVDWNEFDGTTANSHDVLLKQGTGVILNGQDFLIIDGTGGAVTNLAVAGETVDDEYALFNFKAYDGATKVLGASTNADVVVEATHVRGEEVTGNRNNSEAADGILGVTVAQYARDNADGRNELALVYDHVTRANNNQVDERLEAIQSTVDGGNVVAATTVTNITSNIIQLASTDAEGSGIAAGNISNGLRVWAQVFGQTGEQDDRDSVDGYDIDTYGFAVGMDTQALADQMLLGLAFSYADSDVDSDNANRTQTEIDTYQITLYGTYDLDEATYISGQLGYAFGDNSTHREDIGGVAAIDADGDFDSNQFIARLEAGRAYEVGTITTLTPKLMVNYNYYDADSYRETGAGGAGLNVDQDTNHILEIGAGVDADWMFQQADGSYVKPQVRAGVRYDLADDEIEATNRLIGGGNAFKTEGFDPQQFALDLGAGVTYFSTTNWELTANYDFEYKEDYNSHAGFLRAAYKF